MLGLTMTDSKRRVYTERDSVFLVKRKIFGNKIGKLKSVAQ